MLSNSEQFELVGAIKRTLIHLVPAVPLTPIDSALLFAAELVRATMKFEHSRLDHTDDGCSGPAGIAAVTEQPKEVICPHCHRTS